jgi:hypothetical protein
VGIILLANVNPKLAEGEDAPETVEKSKQPPPSIDVGTVPYIVPLALEELKSYQVVVPLLLLELTASKYKTKLDVAIEGP